MPGFDINPAKVQAHLERILVNKSASPDEIHRQLLKIVSPAIAETFALLLHLPMEYGAISNDMSQAAVTPIHKKGSVHDVSNNRSVSLTSVLCKTMEQFVYDVIPWNLSEHFPLTNSLKGYNQRSSFCLTGCVGFFDKKHGVDMVFLYLSKAFIMIQHCCSSGLP